METQRKNRLVACFDEQMAEIKSVNRHAINLRLLQKETGGRNLGLPIDELVEDLERLKEFGHQRLQRLCVELKALGWNRPAGKDCGCDDDEVFRVDRETLTNEMETLLERDESEAFAPEKSTQEKWDALLAVVRRAEVVRTYMYGMYGAGGNMSAFFKGMIYELRKLVWMALREEIEREKQAATTTTTINTNDDDDDDDQSNGDTENGRDEVDGGYTKNYSLCYQPTKMGSVRNGVISDYNAFASCYQPIDSESTMMF